MRRSRNDRQIGARRASREDDVEVVGVRVGSSHEPTRALEARLAKVLVPRRVSLEQQHAVVACCLDCLLMEVEHEERHSGRPELLRDSSADAAVAADDEVVVQLLDRPLPPSFRQRARNDAAGDRLDDNGTRVSDDRDAHRDEHDRDDPRAVTRAERSRDPSATP